GVPLRCWQIFFSSSRRHTRFSHDWSSHVCSSDLVIVVIMRAMIALSAFAAIFAATGDGPGTATQILNLYAYRTAFTSLDFGYGSALAVSLLVITVCVSGFLFRLRTARRR